MEDAKKISIEYENGTVKELNKGIAAEFDNDNMHVRYGRRIKIRYGAYRIWNDDYSGKNGNDSAFTGICRRGIPSG